MSTRWDHLEDVRFVLQRPPKLKRVSKLSILDFFPSLRSPTDETQMLERGHERVSARYPRSRAPTLHLRLSEPNITPLKKALDSPTHSLNSLHIRLIPEKASTVEGISEGHLDLRHPFHRHAPSDVPTSPITPNSLWTFTGSTSRISTSNGHPARSRSFSRTQNRPTHLRGNTTSSTLSNLRVEVVTLSESPPDPGFVLPIPSRSRSRQELNLTPTDSLTRGAVDSAKTKVCDVHSYQPK